MKTISIQQYADLIGYKEENPTLEKIQEYFEGDLTDYPIEELDYLLNDRELTENDFVYVNTEFGVRICETV